MADNTPCVLVCKLVDIDGTKTCLGCNRTLDEIATWHKLTLAEQIKMTAVVRQRRD